MKLYMVPAAPNPTKVLLYMAEREQLGADLGVETKLVNTLKGEHRGPEHLARNPFGTLPVLELDDGSYLLESLAIIEYLEDRFPQGGLLGEDPAARGQARDLERIVELRFTNPVSRYVHAVNSPLGFEPDLKTAKQIEEALPPVLNYLESLLADGRELLLGARPCIADCTLAAALQFARFRDIDLLGDYANLRAWDQRYRTRPAAQKVLKF